MFILMGKKIIILSMVFFTVCPAGSWGVGCNEKCVCYNSAECDPKTGSCICSPGWKGPSCEESKLEDNPFVSNGIFHPYKLDESISNLRVVVLFLTFACKCLIRECSGSVVECLTRDQGVAG